MPNRIIKESVCTSDTVDQLSWFEEVVFYRLIVNCDDYGRFDGRLPIVRNRLFPLKESVTVKAVEASINRLATVGLVCLYEVDGKPYLQLPTWENHQQIRAKKSKYPAPDLIGNHLISDDNICPRNPIQSESNPNPNPIRIQTENARDGTAAVMSAYMDKINPQPSEMSIAELKTFTEQMGAECCLRAIDIAMDARKANWPYVRGILKSKFSQGVRCLADWDKLEEGRAQSGAIQHADSAAGAGTNAKKWNIKSALDDCD